MLELMKGEFVKLPGLVELQELVHVLLAQAIRIIGQDASNELQLRVENQDDC